MQIYIFASKKEYCHFIAQLQSSQTHSPQSNIFNISLLDHCKEVEVGESW